MFVLADRKDKSLKLQFANLDSFGLGCNPSKLGSSAKKGSDFIVNDFLGQDMKS